MLISPYKDQRRLITSELAKRKVTYRDNLTIDAAHGQEAPVVIFLMTKPSENPLDVGFIGDRQRMNVALSRAQKVLIIIGNLKIWNKDKIAGIRRASKKNLLLADLLVDVTMKEHTISWVGSRTVTETVAPPNTTYLFQGRTVRPTAAAARPSAPPVSASPIAEMSVVEPAHMMQVDSEQPIEPQGQVRGRSRVPPSRDLGTRSPSRDVFPRRSRYRSRSPSWSRSRSQYARSRSRSRSYRQRSPPKVLARQDHHFGLVEPEPQGEGDELEVAWIQRERELLQARTAMAEFESNVARQRLDRARQAQDPRDARASASRRDR